MLTVPAGCDGADTVISGIDDKGPELIEIGADEGWGTETGVPIGALAIAVEPHSEDGAMVIGNDAEFAVDCACRCPRLSHALSSLLHQNDSFLFILPFWLRPSGIGVSCVGAGCETLGATVLLGALPAPPCVSTWGITSQRGSGSNSWFGGRSSPLR